MKKIIVGSRFKELTSISPNIEVSDKFNVNDYKEDIIIGQGIYNKSTSSENIVDNLVLEKQEYTHKLKPENIIIGIVSKTSPTSFQSKLIINNDSELLLDHLTGFHIPSMVLMEAARQITAVVVDKYLSSFNSTYTILKKFNNEYIEFVFPFETQILVDITNLIQLNKSFNVSLDVQFIQNGKCSAKTSIEACFYEKNILLELEKRKVSRMIKNIII